MRKLLVCSLAVLAASSVWAAPVGPGGRLYVTRTSNGGADCITQLLRIDVDTNWDVTTNYGAIASPLNNRGLNAGGYLKVTSPEILHPRDLGGDGSVFLAGYFDNGDHTRYNRITPDGTVSLMHPGVGNDYGTSDGFANRTKSTGGFDKSYGAAYVVDRTGQATGRAGSVACVSGNPYGANVWYDMNSNDVLTDPGDAWVYPFYDWSEYDDDLEIGGSPGNGSVQDTMWFHGNYEIHYTQYTGSADCHTWAPNVNVKVFYNWQTAGTDMQYLFRNNGIAVGDTDGDGRTDVYALTTDPQLTAHNLGTIVRLADLDGDGNVDCSTTDLCQIVYDSLTLTGTENDIPNYGYSDLELVQDPATGQWTLLFLQRGTTAATGRIVALTLSDNGAFAGGADNFKVIADGLNAANFALYGLEFDADPAAIPEPATLLLMGTGALGVLGYIRRRRMA